MEVNPSSFKIILGSSSVARRKILAEMGYEFTLMSADIDEKAIRTEVPEDLVTLLAEAKADAIISKLQTCDNLEKDGKATILIASDTSNAQLLEEGGKTFTDGLSSANVDHHYLESLVVEYSGFPNHEILFIAKDSTPKLSVGEDNKDAESALLITCDQVVVYEGMIREKPSNVEEARQFIKGYSGGHAATVSSVLVTNLKTGIRKGGWDKVEIYFHDIPDDVIDNLIEEGLVLKVAGGLIIEHPLIRPYVKEVVGTTDSVMGLPKALTERLLKEAI